MKRTRPKAWELRDVLDDDGIGNALDFMIELVQYMQPHKIGVGLTGSVLENGRSTKDIDVMLYPFDTSSAHTIASVQALLCSFGLTQRYTADVVKARWRKLGSNDTKHVEVWRHANGLRVDVFFFGFPDPEPSFIDGRVV